MTNQIWKSMRMPKDLAERIETIAKREKRSFAAQALLILEKEVAAYDSTSDQAAELRQVVEANNG